MSDASSPQFLSIGGRWLLNTTRYIQIPWIRQDNSQLIQSIDLQGLARRLTTNTHKHTLNQSSVNETEGKRKKNTKNNDYWNFRAFFLRVLLVLFSSVCCDLRRKHGTMMHADDGHKHNCTSIRSLLLNW